MEPIRPDDDELRAEPRKAAAQRPEPEKTRPSAGRPTATGGGKPPGGGKHGKGGKGSSGLLWILVLVVGLAGLAGWYQQKQRIDAMSSQLEEADYWARQSKLALARFEGELTETGEDLQERGTTIEQQLKDQKALIETANSEIRKLWVVANERNRSQLEAHTKAIESLTATADSLTTQVESNSSDVGTLKTGLDETRERVASLTETTAAQGRRLEAQATLDSELQASIQALRGELNQIESQVEQRLQRFIQEQKLAAGGLEGRVSALESDLAELERAQSQINQTEARLDQVENAIESIDASRAQLTSRLVRLSEQVDQLR